MPTPIIFAILIVIVVVYFKIQSEHMTGLVPPPTPMMFKTSYFYCPELSTEELLTWSIDLTHYSLDNLFFKLRIVNGNGRESNSVLHADQLYGSGYPVFVNTNEIPYDPSSSFHKLYLSTVCVSTNEESVPAEFTLQRNPNC